MRGWWQALRRDKSRGDALVLALGLLATAAMALYLWTSLRVASDAAQLLPETGERDLAQVATMLAESSLARTMVLTVGAAEVAEAKQAADELREKLSRHPEVALASTGPDPALADAFWQLYEPRRLLFASERPEQELPGRLSDAGLQKAAQELKNQLALPTAPLVKKVAPGDPLLLLPNLLRRLSEAGADGVQVDEGQFVTRDGKRAVLLVSVRHSALDAEHQAPLLTEIDHQFHGIAKAHQGRVDLQQSGINRFAVASRQSIEADVARISTVSTVAMVALFALLLRSLWLLLVAQIPIVFALLCGATATQLLLGEVHGLTLAFGSTLIGVCIDYPVHFLNHFTLDPHPDGPKAGLRALWPGLWLGALTTVAGFAGLGWSSYPGMRGVAVFASVGVLAAVLATRWFLPRLVAAQPPINPVQRRMAALLEAGLNGLRQRRRLIAALLLAAVALTLAGLPRLQWNDDLAALNTLDPKLKAEDDAVRAQIAALEPGTVVVATAADFEGALQRNDQVALALQGAVNAGHLQHFRSLHSFLWSADLQQRNQRALRTSPQLAERLDRAFAQEGLRAGVFAPFAALLQGPEAAPLRWEDLQATPAGPLLQSFRSTLQGQPAVLTFVSGVRDSAAVAQAVANIPGVRFFDQRSFVNRAYAAYRSSTASMILVGIALILLLILARYRSLRLLAVASVPAILACTATLGLLSLLGQALNLLHLVGLVIVLSIGVDYGVYLAETAARRAGEPATALSIVAAGLSAFLAFGLLGLSSNPAMQALGWTTGLGILFSLALAPTLLLLPVGAQAGESKP
ncbi:MAG: MMPL family transporter [Deltaproteobacteria bacterium]|nr:MMPL family transporter [Deltaproteobacteria bacterium]